MKLVGVLDLRQNLAEHLSQVAQGEDIIIIQRSKPIARLIPYREEPMSEEKAVYNIEQLAPEETARLVALFAPRLVNQLLEQCWQDKSTARRVLLAALIKLEEEP